MFLRIVIVASIPFLLAYKIEKGKEFDAVQYAAQGEKGQKDFIRHHQTAQGAKGHHDKENHQKQYAEKDGHKSGYNHKDGYYADQHKEQKGRKGYHFEDHGRYAKGHSTKGHHNIHKLDEYKKNTDFFDEDNDEGFEERHGGYEANKAVARGGYQKSAHQNKGHNEGKYGILGFKENGAHHFADKGHNNAEGHDAYYGNRADFSKKGEEDGFKKFGYVITHKQ